MVAMPSPAAVATDLEAVTDLVMSRQLIDFPRERARAIVAMVLECVAEAASAPAPVSVPEPCDATRLDVTIINTALLQTADGGYFDEVTFVSDWGTSPIVTGTAATPVREDPEATPLTERLYDLSLHNVALWVADDGANPFPTIVEINDFGKRS